MTAFISQGAQGPTGLPAERTSPLEPGDRYPDFLLPDQKRSVDPFYNLVQGGPIVLDRSERVVETFQGRTELSHAGRALACLDRLSPEPAAETVTMTAPVLIIPRVLDRAFCRRLIDIWHQDNHESGTITMGRSGREAKEKRHQVKRRRDHHVGDPALFQEIFDTVFARIAPEVERAFDVRLDQVEEFKIIRYNSEKGGFFRAHRDNSIPDKAQRRFAMTLNLNTEEYEGGELRFPEFGPNLYRPGTGDAVVFSCSLLYEALDVTKGSRFTLLSFLLDANADRWRQEKTHWFNTNAQAMQQALKAQQAGKGTL